MAIYTADEKNIAGQYDVVVRTGKFPTQGKKVVITKGDTKISFPFSDIPDFVHALSRVALDAAPGTCTGPCSD